MLRVWPTIAPWLEAALAASNAPETLLDVYQCLTTDPSYALLLADGAAFVTHVVPGRSGPVLHFWLAGGNMAGVKELYPLAESFGRTLGCDSMTLIGRLGWLRTFLTRDEAWEPTLVHLEKRLT